MEFAKDRATAALLREEAQYKCFLKQKMPLIRSGKDIYIDIDYYVYRKNGEIHITGTIINNSDKPLGHIPAKINLYTEDGGHIESYEEKNILPSEVSLKKAISFHIKKPDLTKAVKVYVRFSQT
jgi:hypothetical protein